MGCLSLHTAYSGDDRPVRLEHRPGKSCRLAVGDWPDEVALWN